MLNKSLVQKVITLCMALPFSLPCLARQVTDNLSFEQYDRSRHVLTNWSITSHRDVNYIDGKVVLLRAGMNWWMRLYNTCTKA